MNYDALIIGGGPAGTRCALVLARSGKHVGLIEKDAIGGLCLNYGCIPSKTYLYLAELLEQIKMAKRFGIEVEEPRVMWEQAKKRKDMNVRMLSTGLMNSLKSAGVEIIQGEGILKDANTVAVGDQQFTASYIVLACGSEPLFLPNIAKGNYVISTTEILDIETIPKSLLIIGGGVSGIEMASVFLSLGTEVTLIERNEFLLAWQDHEITDELKKSLEKKGCKVYLATEVLSCKDNDSGATTIYRTSDGKEETVHTDKALVAIGRALNSNLLPNLAKIGIKCSGRQIELNEYLQTSIPNVFMIGDAAFRNLTAYGGEREGECVASHILGNPKTIRYEHIPVTVFSNPEIGAIGLTEEEARSKGIDYIVKKSAYAANAKALILGMREGICKIILEKENQKVLGVHIIGVHASDLVHQALLPVMKGMTADEWLEVVFSHPALSEVIKDALNAD